MKDYQFKPGDKVAYTKAYTSGGPVIRRVLRVTSSGIAVLQFNRAIGGGTYEIQFNKNGYQRGTSDRSGGDRIEPWTDAHQKRHDQRRATFLQDKIATALKDLKDYTSEEIGVEFQKALLARAASRAIVAQHS